MEIEVSPEKFWFTAALFLIFSLVGLWFLGNAVTPQEMTFLSWQEWKIYQGQLCLSQEKALLQAAIGDLENLLLYSPDPVRAQFVVHQIKDLSGTFQSQSLQPIYAELLTASQAVQDWSIGMLDWQSANTSVDHVRNLAGWIEGEG